jgi:hypothetical protein
MTAYQIIEQFNKTQVLDPASLCRLLGPAMRLPGMMMQFFHHV